MDSLGTLRPYGEARAVPRGGFTGWLADLLGGAKGFLNQARVPQGMPLVGGLGAGDLTMGQAPETLDSMSYGFSPVRGAGMAATLDPGVADLLGLMAPLAGRAVGVARALPGVARQAALDAYSPAVNVARPRYTLGGREVGRDAMQREFGLAAPTDPAVELAKQLKRDAKNIRERMRYEARVNRENRPWDQEATADRRFAMGEQVMSSDDLLRAILERGKALPQTPQGPVPLPWVSRGATPKY